MSRTASIKSTLSASISDRHLGLSDGRRRVPRSKALVLKSDSRQASRSSSIQQQPRTASRCSSRGPLGAYHQPMEDSDEERNATSRRISQAGTHRFSSLSLQQQMGFYQLSHLEPGTSQDSSPESSPLTTPFGSMEKLKTGKQDDDYMFPLPPASETPQRPVLLDIQQDSFSGLGLDGLADMGNSQVTPLPQNAERVAFAPEHYDSDGLTGSQGWSPSTYAGSVCPSPLQRSESFSGHSRSVSFTQPLSIRKSSGKEGSIIVHSPDRESIEHSFHAEDEHKLARLQSSLALLGIRDEPQHVVEDYAEHASDAASESSPRATPLRLDARMFYSPEHGAPSLAEQLAFACGNGYRYEIQEGVSHHDSALNYLPPWLQQRLEQGRRESMDSQESMGLNPLSGLQADVGDSWTEAHGHDVGGTLSRSTSRSNRTSVYTSTAADSPILAGPLSATQSVGRESSTEEFASRRSSLKPRLSLSPHMSSLREFSYLTIFGGDDVDGKTDSQQTTAVAANAAALMSPPLSTPELARECQEGSLLFGQFDSFPSPVPARPTSIGMRPFAFDEIIRPENRKLVSSKSMVDLHSKSMLVDEEEQEIDGDESAEMTISNTLPALGPGVGMSTSQSTTSVLNRGRPIRQCDYLESKPKVITLTRKRGARPAQDSAPAMPSRSPPPVPARSTSMGRLSASAAIKQSYFEKSKAEEFAQRMQSGDARSTPVQLIPGHRNSGSKSMLAIDKGMLFSPPTPKLPSSVPSSDGIAQHPSTFNYTCTSRSAIDLASAGRPRTLSREASAAMKQAKREASLGGSKKLSKSGSSTLSKPLFSTSIFKRSNGSQSSLPKASKSMVDLHAAAAVGPKDEIEPVCEMPVASTKSSKKASKAKKLSKSESKSFLGRARTKSQSASAPPQVPAPPAAPERSQSEPVQVPVVDEQVERSRLPQQWEVRRPSLNQQGYLRSPAQDSAVFPASHSMPVLFVARTNSQRKRGETGIFETTPSPLLPSDFRSGNRRARATRWSSAKALIDERAIREEEEEAAMEGQRSALPTPSGCVLVVEEHKVHEECIV